MAFAPYFFLTLPANFHTMENDFNDPYFFDEEDEERQELVSDFKTMIDHAERRYFDSDDMIDIIETLIAQFDFKYAEAAIKYSEEVHPNSYECKLLKCRFLIMTLDISSAKKLLDEIENSYTLTADFYLQKALYCKITGQEKDTINLFKKAYRLDPENAGINFMMGSELIKADRMTESLPYIIFAIQNDEDFEEQLFTISYLFEEKKKTDEAVQFFSILADRFPLSKACWFGLGLAYNWSKEPEKAIDAYLNAISLAENGATAYYNIGNTYFEMGQFDNAIDNYSQAYQLDNKDYHALTGIADCYSELQQYEKALDYYHQALDLCADDTEANLGIIHTLKEMGRADDATAFLDNVLQQQQDNFELFFGLITNFETEETRETKIREYIHEHIKSLENKEDFLRLFTIFCCASEQCIDLAINVLEEFLDDEEVAFTIPYLLAALHYIKHEDEVADNYLKTALLINYDNYVLFLAIHPSFEYNQRVQELIKMYQKTND